MRGDTTTTIDGKTLTFDELGCLRLVNDGGVIFKGMGGTLWKVAIDNLEAEGLLSQIDNPEDDPRYEWASSAAEEWYVANEDAIEAFIASAEE